MKTTITAFGLAAAILLLVPRTASADVILGLLGSSGTGTSAPGFATRAARMKTVHLPDPVD